MQAEEKMVALQMDAPVAHCGKIYLPNSRVHRAAAGDSLDHILIESPVYLSRCRSQRPYFQR